MISCLNCRQNAELSRLRRELSNPQTLSICSEVPSVCFVPQLRHPTLAQRTAGFSHCCHWCIARRMTVVSPKRQLIAASINDRSEFHAPPMGQLAMKLLQIPKRGKFFGLCRHFSRFQNVFVYRRSKSLLGRQIQLHQQFDHLGERGFFAKPT